LKPHEVDSISKQYYHRGKFATLTYDNMWIRRKEFDVIIKKSLDDERFDSFRKRLYLIENKYERLFEYLFWGLYRY